MIQEGQIVLFAFPHTDQVAGNLRPALVVRSLPGPHEDWLVCMISLKLDHEISGIDEVVRNTDTDFAETGLKTTSLIRITRLAVVTADILEGTIGSLAGVRLKRIQTSLAGWILGGDRDDEH